jgi:hypothetical protein
MRSCMIFVKPAVPTLDGGTCVIAGRESTRGPNRVVSPNVTGSWRLSDKRFCFFPASRANGMHRRKFAYGEEPGVLLGVGLPASSVDIGNQGPNHIRKRRITMPAHINA